jgi:uncharacterized protein
LTFTPTMGMIIPDMGMNVPEMGITGYEKRISSFLFNKTRRGLLALLFGRPDESFYVNQIMQRLGSGSGAVQRELKLMTEAGIVVRESRGNQVYYQANSGSPIFNELKNIVRKTFGVADVIRESLAPLFKDIKAAFIFGSVARSGDTRASDLDLMVIGTVSFGEVSTAVSAAEKSINREINPVVYPVCEFKEKLAVGHHFLKTVLEGEKIFLKGDENVLGKLAG